jgi:hypothetical protein
MKEDIKGYLAKIYSLETTNQDLERQMQNNRLNASSYVKTAEKEP